MNLDFSTLSDDQLLDLIQACMAEAVNRGAEMKAAAYSIYDEAAEELRIKAEIAAARAAKEAEDSKKAMAAKAKAEADRKAREEAKQKRERIWARKKAIFDALLSHPLFESELNSGKNFQVNTWARGTDLRVYIQDTTRNGWSITYYQTGNGYQTPGSITGIDNEANKMDIAAFCEVLLTIWPEPGLRVSFSEVKEFRKEHSARTRDFMKYFDALSTSNSIKEHRVGISKKIAIFEAMRKHPMFQAFEHLKLELRDDEGEMVLVEGKNDNDADWVSIGQFRRKKYGLHEPGVTLSDDVDESSFASDFEALAKFLMKDWKKLKVESIQKSLEGFDADIEYLNKCLTAAGVAS